MLQANYVVLEVLKLAFPSTFGVFTYLCDLWGRLSGLLIYCFILQPVKASTVMSAKSACVQPGIHGACIQLSILIMFCVKESACLGFFCPEWGGGLMVSTEIVRHCEGSIVPESLINPCPVRALHIHFERLVRCARFLILQFKD